MINIGKIVNTGMDVAGNLVDNSKPIQKMASSIIQAKRMRATLQL